MSLDLVPTNGIEKDICDNIKKELMHIKIIKKGIEVVKDTKYSNKN